MAQTERTPDEILEYCEAATEGPWSIFYITSPDSASHRVFREGDPPEDIAHLSRTYKNLEANSEFIANAREDLPRLARRVKALEALCGEADKTIMDARHRLGNASHQMRGWEVVEEVREKLKAAHKTIYERLRRAGNDGS